MAQMDQQHRELAQLIQNVFAEVRRIRRQVDDLEALIRRFNR